MVSVSIVVAVVLALILSGWLYHRSKKRKSIESYGPLALFHTKKGIKLIDKIANLSPTFWKIFSTIGVVVGFIFMFDVAIGMYLSAKTIITTPTAGAGAVLILPGLEVMGIKIPVVGWLIGIIVLLFSHEFSHGIIARVEKIKVESVGALFLGFLPIGAFVKPDEKQLAKEKPMKQLRIFAAGSFVNLFIAMVIITIIVFAYIPAATSSINGIKLTKVDEKAPAYKAGMREGMTITNLNGEEIKDWPDFVKKWEAKNYSSGEKVQLTTDQGGFLVTLADRGDGRGRAGIVFCGKGIEKGRYPLQYLAPFLLLEPQQVCQSQKTLGDQTFWLGYEILVWIAIINFGVGVVNLLPIKPLDGGLMMETVVKRAIRMPKISDKIVFGVSLFTAIMLLINIGLPHLRNLLKI